MLAEAVRMFDAKCVVMLLWMPRGVLQKETLSEFSLTMKAQPSVPMELQADTGVEDVVETVKPPVDCSLNFLHNAILPSG
mmetsp:Transcript_103374/g.301607  ORF Transcript_103374/g.301607 Transcript_103374/m.301607 type:complete len:80 (+) Transcript_103374:1867-2106(+)